MIASSDIKAFFVAIPVASVTATITIATYLAVESGLPNGANLEGLFFYLAVSAFFVSLAGLLVGAPIVWILRRVGAMKFSVLAVAGFLSGGGVAWLIFPGARTGYPALLMVGAIAGLAAALTWWLIAERRTTLDA